MLDDDCDCDDELDAVSVGLADCVAVMEVDGVAERDWLRVGEEVFV